MNREILAYVYAKQRVQDKWFLSGVDLSGNNLIESAGRASRPIMLIDSANSAFPIFSQDDYEDGRDPRVQINYGLPDSTIDLSSPDRRMDLMSAQCKVILQSRADCLELSVPSFVSHVQREMSVYTVVARMSVKTIQEIPDVLLHRKLQSLSTSMDPDMSMFQSATPPLDLRLPLGFFMPAILELDYAKTPIVYCVREWKDESLARIELVSPRELGEIPIGSRLVRDISGFNEEKFVVHSIRREETRRVALDDELISREIAVTQ
ncbi:MAG: hypothetical protein AAGB29_03905 [Planctomycetota bacterium]